MKPLVHTLCVVLLSTLQSNAFLIIEDQNQDSAAISTLGETTSATHLVAPSPIMHSARAIILAPANGSFAFNTSTGDIQFIDQQLPNGPLWSSSQPLVTRANAMEGNLIAALSTPNSSAGLSADQLFAAPARTSAPLPASRFSQHPAKAWSFESTAFWLWALKPAANSYTLLGCMMLLGLCLWRRKQKQDARPTFSA